MTATAPGQEATSPGMQKPRHVHTITDRFAMTNTYLIDDQGLVVVDPDSALSARQTLYYITRFLHRSTLDIDLIILTHLHADHTAGIDVLRRASGARVAALAAGRYLARGEQESRSVREMASFAGQLPPEARRYLDFFSVSSIAQARLVDIWLEDVAGVPKHPDWRVIATPCYQRESLCLYNPFSGELICGETIVTSEGGLPVLQGERRRQTQETLRLLRSLQVRYLYPGHGKPLIAEHASAHIRIE